jgi:hypothetical protein
MPEEPYTKPSTLFALSTNSEQVAVWVLWTAPSLTAPSVLIQLHPETRTAMSTWTRKPRARLRRPLDASQIQIRDLKRTRSCHTPFAQYGPNRPPERGFFLYTPPRLQTACFSFVLIFLYRHSLARSTAVEFPSLYITAESYLHQIYFSWRQRISLVYQSISTECRNHLVG